jgi:hypothetical protein
VDYYLTIVGFILTVFSTTIAVYQTRSHFRSIRKQKENIWNQISQMKGMLRGLERSPLSNGGRLRQKITREGVDQMLLEGKHNLVDYEAITVTEMSLMAEFRNQLQIAVSLENKFSLDTIDKWYKIGKLSSKWQVRQVCQLLDLKNVPLADLEKHRDFLIECEVSTKDELTEIPKNFIKSADERAEKPKELLVDTNQPIEDTE